MSFREHLEQVCRSIDGAVACSLMGVDGIEVDTHLAGPAEGLDLRSLLVEYSDLFRSARDSAVGQQTGEMAELALHTEKLVTVARLVSPDYFIVVVLAPGGNYGKARYLLRIAAPKVRSEL